VDPTKILVCGDWHGEFRAAQAATRQANRLNCDAVFQVGDFGFWPHTNPEYVTQVNATFRRASKRRDQPLNVYWIDGNHENFDMLLGGDWEKTPEGFWQIDEHVFYVPRATRWEWSGVKFLALGGAHSIDKNWRLTQGPIGQYWWPQETIKTIDTYNCLGPEVDVMFTHDMPEGTELGIRLYKLDREDENNRFAVRQVADAVKPKLLFHGHYHHGNESLLQINDNPPIKVLSLDMYRGGLNEHNDDFWRVLSLTSGEPRAGKYRLEDDEIHTVS
jgi:predicted phosphodiesterase